MLTLDHFLPSICQFKHARFNSLGACSSSRRTKQFLIELVDLVGLSHDGIVKFLQSVLEVIDDFLLLRGYLDLTGLPHDSLLILFDLVVSLIHYVLYRVKLAVVALDIN